MQKQQPNRKVLLFLATLVVLAGIVWGALFLIAPIWQPGTPVAYMPALPQTEAAAESAPTQLVDLNTADAETLQTLPSARPKRQPSLPTGKSTAPLRRCRMWPMSPAYQSK